MLNNHIYYEGIFITNYKRKSDEKSLLSVKINILRTLKENFLLISKRIFIGGPSSKRLSSFKILTPYKRFF